MRTTEGQSTHMILRDRLSEYLIVLTNSGRPVSRRDQMRTLHEEGAGSPTPNSRARLKGDMRRKLGMVRISDRRPGREPACWENMTDT